MFSKRVEGYKDIETASKAAIFEFINGLANNTSDYVSRWKVR